MKMEFSVLMKLGSGEGVVLEGGIVVVGLEFVMRGVVKFCVRIYWLLRKGGKVGGVVGVLFM